MIQTVEAIIDEQGNVRLLQNILLPRGRRALVTVLEEAPGETVAETALLSQGALAVDWLRDEEEKAWTHLQSEP